MIIKAPKDFLAAYQSLARLPRREALQVVDDLLETLDHVRDEGGPNSVFAKGRLADRARAARLELMKLRTGEREFFNLTPPPSTTELYVAGLEAVRKHDYDAWMRNDGVRELQRELLEDLEVEEAERAEVAEYAEAQLPLYEESRLDEIAAIRRQDYDSYMRNDDLRAEDLELRQEILGESDES